MRNSTRTLTARETARVMREVAARYSREQTEAMTRAEYREACARVAIELYP